MSTEKMREEFEAWAAAHFWLCVLGQERNPHQNDEYCEPEVQAAWEAWQASRAAVVVEMPPMITADDAAEAADLEDERAVTVAHMVNGAIAVCGAFIKAAGLGVK